MRRMALYYFDTSIWLDLFEERNEPHLPKSLYASNALKRIILIDDKIIFTTVIIEELKDQGYSYEEIQQFFSKISLVVIYRPTNKNLWKRAKDIAKKRNIPIADVLHALQAREHHAVLVSRDHHFFALQDICKTKRPEDIN